MQAREIWQTSIDQLAVALASIINVLDPQCIIIGGGVAQSGAALFKPLVNAMDHVEWRPTGQGVPIVAAQLGPWAGAIGAAFNALKEGHA